MNPDFTFKSLFDRAPLMRMFRARTKRGLIVLLVIDAAYLSLAFYTTRPTELGGSSPALVERFVFLAVALVICAITKILVEVIGRKRLAALRRDNPVDSAIYQQHLDSHPAKTNGWSAYWVFLVLLPVIMTSGLWS